MHSYTRVIYVVSELRSNQIKSVKTQKLMLGNLGNQGRGGARARRARRADVQHPYIIKTYKDFVIYVLNARPRVRW